MKKLISLVLLLSASAGLAVPIVYEGFDYPLGVDSGTNLVGHATADGFTWNQAGPTTGGTNVPSTFPGNLAYPGLAPSMGNSAHFGGIDSGGMAARFSLQSPVNTGAIYYSFLINILETNGLSSSGVFFVGFNNSAGDQATVPSVVGTRLVAKLSGSGFQLGLDKSSGGAANFQWEPTIFGTGQTIMVVGRYTFGPNTGDDFSDMWVNPGSGTFGAASPPTTGQLTVTAGGDLNGNVINSLCLFNRNAGEPRSMVIDELTIGTNWADVTPSASALAFTTQPQNQSTVQGSKAAFSVTAYRAQTFQWQHNGTDIPGATTATLSITNAQLLDAGGYRVVIGNGVISSNSATATLTVYPDIYPRLKLLWSIAPNERPYMSTDTAASPNQRYFAYSAVSNQVLLVSRTNLTVDYPTNTMIYVLDGTTGNDLYTMDTDPFTIAGGVDVTGGGTNILTLNAIDVAEDGAVYAANVGQGTSPGTWLRVYRWENSSSNAAPNLIYESDPVGFSNLRWGDCIGVRGAGESTEILLDTSTGIWGAILKTNTSIGAWAPEYFTNAAGGLTGGRTLLYYGTANAFWEKHGGGGLNLVSYDLPNHDSTVITNYPNLPGSPNLLAFNSSTNLLCGIGNDNPSAPDTLDLYDYSNPTQPLLVASYSFPVTHQANNNGNGRVIFSGDRVYVLNSNNGMMAFVLVPRLNLSTSGADVVLSWSSAFSGYNLEASPSLSASATWTNAGPATLAGDQYYVTNSPAGGGLFYRLKK